MRILLVLMLLIFSMAVKAQTYLPGIYMGHLQQYSPAGSSLLKDSATNKKWFVSKYAGISSSVSFFNGGNATVMAVPIGIQINRRLNNNWYAFAGLSAAPAYVNFNHAFLSTSTNKSWQPNNFLQSSRFDMYSRAEMGLMYTNDQKTFSISGSIGIERSSYPMIPVNQPATVRPKTFVAPNK